MNTTTHRYLVTGASGYISSWVCKYLLEDDQHVHATVRNVQSEKCKYLKELKQQYPKQLQLFEADLLKSGSFDEAIQNCDYVLHMASPFFTKFTDADKDLVEPAIKGTEEVLNAATKTSSVKRVIVTSSIASLMGDAQDVVGKTVDETFWNTTSNKTHQAYPYSKVEAEKAAWRIAKNQDQWDLVTINPGFVLGPSLTNRNDSTSIGFLSDMLNGKFPLVPDFYFAIADVRDVARAHILAANNENASGRYLITNDVYSFYDLGNILKEKYSQYPLPKAKVPKFIFKLVGNIMAGYTRKMIDANFGINYKIDNSRSVEDLKIEYTDVRASLNDQAEQLIKDGLVKKR